MKIQCIKTGIALAIVLLIASCSPKIYRPPALGAEYQLDRGLPPAKSPAHLFDEKMEANLIKRGMLPGKQSNKSTVTTRKTTTAATDSSKAASTAPAGDSTHLSVTPPKKQE